MANRRQVLAALGAAATGVTGAPAAVGLDLDRPEDNLRAYVKLRGDLGGRPAYDVIRGRIFGLVDGEPPRPLFRTAGAQVSRYERVGPLEYAARTRYAGLLIDWETDTLLDRWVNPYTGRACDAPVTRYGPSVMRVLSDRLAPPGGTADTPGAPAIRPWYRMGGVVHMVDQVYGPAPAGRQPDVDLMTFSGEWAALCDRSLTRIPSRLSFSAVEHWRDWMGMDREGSLLWHVTGVKLAGPAEYPDRLAAMVKAEDPGFFDGAAP